MAYNDELGCRMKENYEKISQTRLMRRTPVAIRIDGKNFHSWARGFKRPFDDILIKSMQETMKYLCENIQGCVLGYTQSDEITLILQDYKALNTEAWFDYKVQKMCSVSASMATMKFNDRFNSLFTAKSLSDNINGNHEDDRYLESYAIASRKGAQFDSRCFNIPKEEVTNLLFWRQLDAARNSVQMTGRYYFSSSELFLRNSAEIRAMLADKGVKWSDFPIYLRYGSCCIKDDEGHWFIDKEIPMFKGEGREYVERLINCEEE